MDRLTEDGQHIDGGGATGKAVGPLRKSQPRESRVSRNRWLSVLALCGSIGLVVGCRSEEGRTRAEGSTRPDESWKAHRSATEGTDFNSVPPGQTISPAALGTDLP